MGAFWGLLAAVSIGSSDFFGRRIVGANGPLTAALAVQIFAALVAFALSIVVGGSLILADLGLGAISGLATAAGLGFYYFGLERSSATVVAPTVATLAAVIPFAYTLVRGEDATTIALVGALVAFFGLAVIGAGQTARHELVPGLIWGGLSGLGYGIGLSALVEASDESGTWPAASMRLVSAVALLLAVMSAGAKAWPDRGLRGHGLVAGALSGLTSAFYLLGLQFDAPQTVVTTATFPVFAVLVGFLAFGDRVSKRQIVGIALVFAGTAAVVV